MPKENGGLGIPDLRILGFALRLRWEWLRRTDTNFAWSKLPSTTERAVDRMFQSSVSLALGDGSTAKFWTDAWLSAGAISSFAPNLLRAVGRRHRNRTGKDALHLRIRPCLGTHRRRPAAATGVRPLHLEMDAERRILRFLGLSVGHSPWACSRCLAPRNCGELQCHRG